MNPIQGTKFIAVSRTAISQNGHCLNGLTTRSTTRKTAALGIQMSAESPHTRSTFTREINEYMWTPGIGIQIPTPNIKSRDKGYANAKVLVVSSIFMANVCDHRAAAIDLPLVAHAIGGSAYIV